MGKVQGGNGGTCIQVLTCTLSHVQLQVDNEVLAQLQEELEGMGNCLERLGLPTPDMQKRIHRTPWVIVEEMFDVESQWEISN